MSKEKLESFWVPPEFKKKLKIEATRKGYPSMAEYLRDLSSNDIELSKEFKRNEKKKPFNLRF